MRVVDVVAHVLSANESMNKCTMASNIWKSWASVLRKTVGEQCASFILMKRSFNYPSRATLECFFSPYPIMLCFLYIYTHTETQVVAKPEV